jgi:hypothetical protein
MARGCSEKLGRGEKANRGGFEFVRYSEKDGVAIYRKRK